MSIFKIESLPNFLTMLRFALTPLILLVVLRGEGMLKFHVFGFILFFIASLSDFADGYIARRWRVTSGFGVCFDPIADKVLVLSLLCAILRMQKVDTLPCLIIVVREVSISGIREFLASKKISIPVSNGAKWKSLCQFIAIGFIILSLKSGDMINNVGNFFIWIAAGLTIWTMIGYLKQIKASLK